MPSTMFWITSKTENRLLIVVSEMVELFRKTSRKFRKIAKEFPGSCSKLAIFTDVRFSEIRVK